MRKKRGERGRRIAGGIDFVIDHFSLTTKRENLQNDLMNNDRKSSLVFAVQSILWFIPNFQ